MEGFQSKELLKHKILHYIYSKVTSKVENHTSFSKLPFYISLFVIVTHKRALKILLYTGTTLHITKWDSKTKYSKIKYVN